MTTTQYSIWAVMIVGIILTFITPQKSAKVLSRHWSIIFFVVLVIIAIGRPSKMADYSNYVRIVQEFDTGRYEPATIFLNYVVHLFNKPVFWFLFFFAILGIGIKLYALKSVPALFFGGVIVYLSNFFVLHDLIQIRAAVASGCVLMLIKYSAERDVKGFIVFYLLAILFHYSALVGGIIWFLDSTHPHRWLYVFSLLTCYYIGKQLQSVAQGITPFLATMFSDNATAIQVGGDESFLMQIKQIVICASFWCFANRLKVNPICMISLKVYTIGICLGWVFSEFANLAMRTADMLIVSEIFLIPSVVYICHNKVVSRLLIVLYVLYTFRGVIITPDYWNPI